MKTILIVIFLSGPLASMEADFPTEQACQDGRARFAEDSKVALAACLSEEGKRAFQRHMEMQRL